MTEIEKAKALWRLCGNMQLALSASDRVQIANSFKAMIEKAEQAEGFEAFKREVSDAVEERFVGFQNQYGCLQRFIITKPDPLVEAMIECGFGDSSNAADDIRAALAKRGLEIREIEG